MCHRRPIHSAFVAAALLGAIALPGRAAAAPPTAGNPETKPPAPEVEPDDPSEGTARAAPPDDRAGHILIAGRGGFTLPFGSVASEYSATDLVAIGPVLGGSIGVGLGRYGVLEGSFDYATLSGARRPAASGVPDRTETCANILTDKSEKTPIVGDACRGKTWDLSLGLSYHLAQGIAFDPWMSYGVGYRSLSVDAVLKTDLPGGGKSATFRGIDIAKIALGGDFYPIPSVGFGPYLELDLGTYVDRPGDAGASTYAFFGVGGRVVFDPVRALRPPKTAVGLGFSPAHASR